MIKKTRETGFWLRTISNSSSLHMWFQKVERCRENSILLFKSRTAIMANMPFIEEVKFISTL